jgi:hypothetical protein
MKTVRTYLTGCTWCNATGFVYSSNYGMGTTPLTVVCPVCQGAKIIMITETIESNVKQGNNEKQ